MTTEKTQRDKRQQRRANRRAGLTPPSVIVRMLTERKYMSRTMKKALVDARKRQERLIEQPCPEGNCVDLVDPDTGRLEGGWGPVGCPCDDMREFA